MHRLKKLARMLGSVVVATTTRLRNVHGRFRTTIGRYLLGVAAALKHLDGSLVGYIGRYKVPTDSLRLM